MQSLFELSLILLATAAVMAAVAARLRLPTLLGYLAGGMILGPSVLGLVEPGEALSFLAELGVVFLLFMVGLEFSVAELWATRRRVLAAGGLQALFTGAAIGALAFVSGSTLPASVLLGGAGAMSSTAISAKQLSEQGELTTRHGRMAVSVLLFQDLSAIPLLTLLAVWGRGEQPGISALLMQMGQVLALFAVAASLTRPVLHRVLAWVARHGTAEAFLLAALLATLGAAFAAHLIGISAALGAFLAGMVLGESDFRHQVEDDIRPFRDLLIGLFFITVGLQLDAGELTRSPGGVLLWLALLVPAKLLLNRAALRLAGLSPLDAWRSAVILAHGGEFGLMLLASALAAGILPPEQGQPPLVALALSMGAAPLLIRHHDRLAEAFSGRRRHPPLPQEEEAEGRRLTEHMRGHVVIGGAGHLGRLIARALELADVPHLLVECDYEAFSAAREAGLPVLYGDASRPATLRGARVAEAKMAIITFHRLAPAVRLARWLRHEYPHLAVIASTLTDRDARQLLAIPGLRVYAVKPAAALAIAEQALLEIGLPAEAADALISRLRLDLQAGDRRN